MVTSTYPFFCMVFSLCLSASVPIWYIDQIKTPRKGTRLEVPLIGENLEDIVEQA